MIPSALASQLEQGLRDFLRTSFDATTPGFDTAIERLLAEPGRLIKGPHVQLALPFVRGSKPNWFPKVPLPFTPHKHQESAFARLGGKDKKGTLIATGTGSGKSESFLWPILAHCEAHAAQPGIKAILIYPMNALATDQALRVAEAVHGNPHLKGKVRAGLYIGSDGEGQTFAEMGTDHVITDRQAMQQDPPDILLTNYKMLDYLMVRPRDRRLWRGSNAGSLRFLVVDEIHTFDGAQGTDLACLVRRLKARLKIDTGQLCCVGTSATLGGAEAGEELRRYAAQVFGEPFDGDAIVGEVRQDQAQFFGESMITGFKAPGSDDFKALSLEEYERPADYLQAQLELWLGKSALSATPNTDEWAVELGLRLREHATLRNLLGRLSGAPRDLAEVAADLGRAIAAFKAEPELGRRALISFLSLISTARVWRDELPAIAEAREAQGKPRPTDPLLQVRVQLWQREMRRMVANLGEEPRLRFSDDLTIAERRAQLPVIHCRDCGAMGWATLHSAADPDNLRVDLKPFYTAYFSGSPDVRFLFPVPSADRRAGGPPGLERRVDVASLRAQPPQGEDRKGEHKVLEIAQVRDGRTVKDCPFCGARATLSLVGFQAATLTSVYIDQLFSSPWNDDKKLLAFSDSVQDASHRAGFFGGRTWRFNVRVALAAFLREKGPLSLGALAREFPESLHDESKESRTQFVGSFIPKNMEWMSEYDALLKDGLLAATSTLHELVEKRLSWEIFEEFGLRSRLGRSFLRCGFASAAVEKSLLDAAVQDLLSKLPQEVAWLRDLKEEELRQFLIGMLHYLRERGGVLHALLPDEFLDSAGKKTWLFKVTPYLPDLGPSGRLPSLLSDRDQGQFDQPGKDSSWYARWCGRTLGAPRPLCEPQIVYSYVIEALTRATILTRRDTTQPIGHCWGLNPEAVQITTEARRAACERCGHAVTVPAVTVPERGGWDEMPCLSARCRGFMRLQEKRVDYFAHLYANGEIARIVAREHTGLLGRSEREALESQFKQGSDRQPWYPNLLSCTPTLEMGINIGDLSSVMLCSVPPAQANYLQRIGRAGRRDGNSLVLTIANAGNHDLYFFEDPNEMMAGAVRPPGLYLDACAVLERQLTAWCFDRWAEKCPSEDALPRKLREIYPRLEKEEGGRFPHDLRVYIVDHQRELLDGFKQYFASALRPETMVQLELFLQGDQEAKSGLVWRMLSALHEEKKQTDEYGRQLRRLKERIELEKAQPLDDAGQKQVDELERELAALAGLRRQLDDRDTLNFFTDEGLLPNYAFPEAAVRLRSVVWRKRSRDAAGYETFHYEYDRPGEAALSELAPDSTFYAGGRHVRIDRIDLQGSGIESWRFCDQCDHAAQELAGTMGSSCPMCSSAVWADAGRVINLVRLRQVFASTSDRDSRSSDDREDRVPSTYLRDTQVTFKDEARTGAWVLGKATEPFGWEFLSSASFREINYGAQSTRGNSLTIAGRTAVRAGFVICNKCGQLQDAGANATPKHTPSCKAKNPAARGNFIECVYLYRAFDSEAVRILLPIVDFASNREVQSLVAAIRTGLRLYFGGRVDHLRMTLESEPIADSMLRRQYLVLYDSVPGGTGYLGELVRKPAHFFDLLEQALRHLVECGCASDPDRDGCYRCVFHYRASHDMEDISRSTAVALLSSILGRRGSLEEVKKLSDVSIKGLVDSALERKFIEVLRRAGTDARPSIVSPAFVNGKPGWRWQIGSRIWLIEPQRNHAPNEGFGIGLSIDFVFHPGDGVSAGEPTFAVFLDGWQYHADRVGKDMLQRMSAKASGRYVTWSFTWDDVAGALDQGTNGDIPELLTPPAATLARFGEQLGLGGAPGAFRDRTSLQLFVDRLAGDLEGIKLRRLAGALLLASVKPIERPEWELARELNVPTALRPMMDPAGGLLGKVSPGTASFPVSQLIAVPREGVAGEYEAISQDQPLKTLHAAFVLGDSVNEESRQTAWAALLRTANLLSELQGPLFFFAQPESLKLDHGALMAIADARGPKATPWDEVRAEVSDGFRKLVADLEAEAVALPLVGIDLPDTRGRAGAILAELAWEDRRVAVLDDLARPGAEARVAAGWLILSLSEAVSSFSVLVAALREREGSPQ